MNKLAFMILLSLASCVSSSKIQNTGVKEIRFGSGGGFVGKEDSYTLRSDGNIIDANDLKINKLKSRSTLDFFNLASNLRDYSFDHPSNHYYFIEIRSKDNSLNKIVWSDESDSVKTEVLTLHQKLMNTVAQ